MSKQASRRRNKSKIDPLMDISDEGLGDYLFDKKRLTTPAIIDNNIRRFCKQISPTESPVFLPVQPLNWSRLNYCNKNVERMIQLHGGKAVLGYKLWYVPLLYIEAERHTVWCSPDKELMDITFNKDGENQTLFLPVPVLKTVVVQSYAKPRMAFHPRIKSFIENQEKMEKLQAQIFDIRYDDTWDGWERSLSFETWSLKNQKVDSEKQ